MTEPNIPEILPPLSPRATRSPGAGGRSAWGRPLALAGLVAGAVALGAGAYAATGATSDMGWRQSMRLAFVQHAIGRALDGVGASAE